jgi:predicted RNA-binding protein (virulence factor B family)
MEAGKAYTVFVFLDKKNRITASTKLDKFFSPQPPDYEEGEEVDLLIYDQTDLGYKAIINNAHQGMIYKNEVFRKVNIGQSLKGYIKKVRPDLKIDLSLQQAGLQMVDHAARDVLRIIKDLGGSIALTDKSPPTDIYSLFGISKKTFKKAVGALYKRRLITVGAYGIKLAGTAGRG